MTTTRTYGSREEVCHAFAHQRVDIGKAGNIFFEGPLIYSYGKHFCMARLVGDSTVLMTTDTYSKSTASHMSHLRSAVRHKRSFYVSDPVRPFARSAIEDTIRRVNDQIDVAGKRQAWRTDLRDNDLAGARQIYDQMQELREFAKRLPAADTEDWGEWPRFGDDLHKRWAALGRTLKKEFDVIVEARLKQTKAQAKAEERRRAEATRKAAEARKLDMEIGEVQLEGWQRYEPVTGRNFMRSLDHHGLRISEVDHSLVETTLGQSVPAKDCIDVWPMLKTIYLTGRHMENGYRIGNDARQVTLGGFRVDFIDSAGNLHVGCHTFKKETVYRLASDLGLS